LYCPGRLQFGLANIPFVFDGIVIAVKKSRPKFAATATNQRKIILALEA